MFSRSTQKIRQAEYFNKKAQLAPGRRFFVLDFWKIKNCWKSNYTHRWEVYSTKANPRFLFLSAAEGYTITSSTFSVTFFSSKFSTFWEWLIQNFQTDSCEIFNIFRINKSNFFKLSKFSEILKISRMTYLKFWKFSE